MGDARGETREEREERERAAEKVVCEELERVIGREGERDWEGGTEVWGWWGGENEGVAGEGMRAFAMGFEVGWDGGVGWGLGDLGSFVDGKGKGAVDGLRGLRKMLVVYWRALRTSAKELYGDEKVWVGVEVRVAWKGRAGGVKVRLNGQLQKGWW